MRSNPDKGLIGAAGFLARISIFCGLIATLPNRDIVGGNHRGSVRNILDCIFGHLHGRFGRPILCNLPPQRHLTEHAKGVARVGDWADRNNHHRRRNRRGAPKRIHLLRARS